MIAESQANAIFPIIDKMITDPNYTGADADHDIIKSFGLYSLDYVQEKIHF